MDGMREECRKKGLVRTLFGRKIHLPGINDKNPMRRNYAERQAINAPIQGTAADIIKRAMIRVPAALARAGLKAEMLLQVQIGRAHVCTPVTTAHIVRRHLPEKKT